MIGDQVQETQSTATHTTGDLRQWETPRLETLGISGTLSGIQAGTEGPGVGNVVRRS